MSVWADGWRLSVGTLTALPVRPPTEVDPRRAGIAIAIAPVTALLLAVPAAAVAWAGGALGTPDPVLAILVVGVLALGNRGLHLDGLADTVDGLAAPKERAERLAIMRRGDLGPVGAVALLIVLGAQVAALVPVLGAPDGWVVVIVVVCTSRCALSIACARGVPAARDDGLGSGVAGSVPLAAAAACWVAAGAVVVAAVEWVATRSAFEFSAPLVDDAPVMVGYASQVSVWFASGASSPVQTVLSVVAAAVVVALLVRRAVRTLGGVTGDVCGAAVEIALAVLLVGLVV